MSAEIKRLPVNSFPLSSSGSAWNKTAENRLPDLVTKILNGTSARRKPHLDQSLSLKEAPEDSGNCAGWDTYLEESFQDIPFSPPSVGNPEPAQNPAVEAPTLPKSRETKPELPVAQKAGAGNKATPSKAGAAVPTALALHSQTSKAALQAEGSREPSHQRQKQPPSFSGQASGAVPSTKGRKRIADGGMSMRDRQPAAQIGSTRRSASPLRNGLLKKRSRSAANLSSLAHEPPSSGLGKPPPAPKRPTLQLEEDDPFREFPSSSARAPPGRGAAGVLPKPAAATNRSKTPTGTALRNGGMSDIMQERSQAAFTEAGDRPRQSPSGATKDGVKRRAAPRPNPGSEQAARAIDQIKAARDAKQSKHTVPTSSFADGLPSKQQSAREEVPQTIGTSPRDSDTGQAIAARPSQPEEKTGQAPKKLTVRIKLPAKGPSEHAGAGDLDGQRTNNSSEQQVGYSAIRGFADLVGRIGIASMGGETLHMKLPSHYLPPLTTYPSRFSSSDSAGLRSSPLSELLGTTPPRRRRSGSDARTRPGAVGHGASRPTSVEALSPFNLGETEPALPQSAPMTAGHTPLSSTVPPGTVADSGVKNEVPPAAGTAGPVGPPRPLGFFKIKFKVGAGLAAAAAGAANAAPAGGTLRDGGSGTTAVVRPRGSRSSGSGDAVPQPRSGDELTGPSTRKHSSSERKDLEARTARSGGVAAEIVPAAREPAADAAALASGVQTEAATAVLASGRAGAAKPDAVGAVGEQAAEVARRLGTCDAEDSSQGVFKAHWKAVKRNTMPSPDMTHFVSRACQEGSWQTDVIAQESSKAYASSAEISLRPQEGIPERRSSPQRGAVAATLMEGMQQDGAVQAPGTGQQYRAVQASDAKQPEQAAFPLAFKPEPSPLGKGPITAPLDDRASTAAWAGQNLEPRACHMEAMWQGRPQSGGRHRDGEGDAAGGAKKDAEVASPGQRESPDPAHARVKKEREKEKEEGEGEPGGGDSGGAIRKAKGQGTDRTPGAGLNVGTMTVSPLPPAASSRDEEEAVVRNQEGGGGAQEGPRGGDGQAGGARDKECLGQRGSKRPSARQSGQRGSSPSSPSQASSPGESASPSSSGPSRRQRSRSRSRDRGRKSVGSGHEPGELKPGGSGRERDGRSPPTSSYRDRSFGGRSDTLARSGADTHGSYRSNSQSLPSRKPRSRASDERHDARKRPRHEEPPSAAAEPAVRKGSTGPGQQADSPPEVSQPGPLKVASAENLAPESLAAGSVAGTRSTLHTVATTGPTSSFAARPVCHEQGVQTDACELLMEVTFADCVQKMVKGVPEMKLENSAELHRKGRDTKRYADQLANDPKFKELLHDGNDPLLYKVVLTYLKSCLWFLAAYGLHEVEPPDAAEHYIQVVRLIKHQTIGQLEQYKQGDPHMRSLLRFFADRIAAISYVRAATCHASRVLSAGQALKQLPREDKKLNKVSPNDSINSAMTSAGKPGPGPRGGTAARPPAARPPVAAGGGHQQVTVPESLLKSYDLVITSAENGAVGFNLFKKTADGLATLSREAKHLLHVIFAVEMLGSDSGVDTKKVFWYGTQAARMISELYPVTDIELPPEPAT